jgi:hypothetical protein
MLSYLKENGFPAELHIETIPFEDVSEGYKGWQSTVTNETEQVLDIFCHKDYHARVLWAGGYFVGIKCGQKKL